MTDLGEEREAALEEWFSEAPPVHGSVDSAPVAGVASLPAAETSTRRAAHADGVELLGRGLVGAAILAGGAATRFGGVKAAAMVAGRPLLHRKLDSILRSGGCSRLFVMVSPATRGPIESLLSSYDPPVTTEVLEQSMCRRAAVDGSPLDELAPTGHGDFPGAVMRSGALSRFLEAGGRYVFLSNLDNLYAAVDPVVVATHAANDVGSSVEVTPRAQDDVGGAPVRVDGHLRVLEQSQLARLMVPVAVELMNTNSFLLRADQLTDVDPGLHVVEKVAGGRTVLQFERFISETTAAMTSGAVLVDRAGNHGRFEAIKTRDDLAASAAAWQQRSRARAGAD